MVEQSIQKGRGDDGIAEDVAPFRESAVRGEDHGALLVAGVDELEEEVAATRHDRQVADLVDDEELGSCEVADALAQRAFLLGLGERGDEVGERREGDALASPSPLPRRARWRDGFCRFRAAPSRCTTSRALDEGQLGKRQDAVPVERRLEGEVEAASVLIVVSLASSRAVLILRFSRMESSSIRIWSSAPMASISPCSMRRMAGRAPRAHGACARPPGFFLMLSSVVGWGLRMRRSWAASRSGELVADRLVDSKRAAGDALAGSQERQAVFI